jgi:hypothetical protein
MSSPSEVEEQIEDQIELIVGHLQATLAGLAANQVLDVVRDHGDRVDAF